MSDEQLSFGWSESPQAGPGEPELLPRARALRDRLALLARRGVYVGTSSWKYPGWLGQIYNPARYEYRGRVARSRFNDRCLEEYARVFPTVCGDFAFYSFPTESFWNRTLAQVPGGFR